MSGFEELGAGRFPHRDRALGRVNTPDEQAFLDAGGFAG